MSRLSKELLRGIPSIQTLGIAKVAPERSVLAMTIHTVPTCKESENFKSTKSTVYVNRYGETACNLVTPFLSYGYCQIRLLMRQRRLCSMTIVDLQVTCPYRLGKSLLLDSAVGSQRNLVEVCTLSM